ncbi:radical SAM/SPASM domain-containing protein [Burkholderia sp. D-99]|uniref:radical SAM/SPASM domain-containing protein n=1 Tax=Burkholderia sp. D-99 TaxID=2717316 RepID=UPI00141F2BAC|nr:radical SAM protein [Burkholderia sp. D-99]NHV28054.1 SPASM domain-containing protein [Burkholderia sp. D-99]
MTTAINVIRRSENTRLVTFRNIVYGESNASLIKHTGGYLLFDVTTSTAHALSSDDAAHVERYVDTKDAADLLASPTISRLIESGALFAADAARKAHRKTDRMRLQDVVVQIAYGCNLKCTYCYADEGEYGGGKQVMMSTETAERVVDFAFEHRGSSSLGFAILGGEPLLNQRCLRHFVEYAAERGRRDGVEVEFSITTNGIGINEELLAFFDTYKIAVRLSMDGTKDINDRYRINNKGGGTYDAVNFKYGAALKESPVKFQVRASYFGEHGDRLLDQARTMVEELGYDDVKMDFIWGVDGTVGEVTQDNLDLTLNGIDHLSTWFNRKVLDENFDWRNFNPYSKYMGRLVQKPVATNIYLEEDKGDLVAGGSILENSGVECGAGINVISVSASGEIYTCHRTEGNPKFKMGDVFTGVDASFIEYWSDNWRLTHPDADCSRCWARFVCLGGCPAFGVYKKDNPMQNDRVRCQLRRQFIANSIILHTELEQRLGKTKDIEGRNVTP